MATSILCRETLRDSLTASVCQLKSFRIVDVLTKYSPEYSKYSKYVVNAKSTLNADDQQLVSGPYVILTI